MYVKVIQYCIFALTILNTKGFPQENTSSANVAPSKELSGDVPTHNAQLGDPPNNDTPADNDANDNEQPAGDEENNERPAGDEDNSEKPADNDEENNEHPADNNEDNNEQPADNDEDNNEQPAGEKDNNDDIKSSQLGFPTDKGYPDYYETNAIFKGIYKFPFMLPKPNELLDRNKPEAGFDLTHEEMMKLKLWPDALIPYYIDVHSFSDKVLRDKIRSFLSSVNSLTSLNFVELPSPPNDNSRWVFFINRRGLLGCADHSIKNFTNTGVQHVILGYHCMSTDGELAEAVLAIVGVPAQHNAPDRDYYIKINEGNIMPEKLYLFDKLSDDEWLFHDLEYDFESAGHFHSYKHSINGRATIELQEKSGDVIIGESKTLTAIDIQKIRMLYNYIVKKKLLQAPDCHKLFMPGKKFSQYKPDDNNLKPRPKPYKYTGEAPDASLEEGDDETVLPPIVNPDQDQNENNDVLPNPEGDLNENRDDKPNTNNNENDNADENQLPNETKSPDDYQIPNDINIPDQKSNEINALPESDADNNEQQPEYDYKDNGQGNNDLPNENAPISDTYNKEDEDENYSPSEFHRPEKKPTIISIGKGNIQTLKFVKPVSDLVSYLSDYDDDRRNTKVKQTKPKITQKNYIFKLDQNQKLKFKGLG